jgi:hypothetical protein
MIRRHDLNESESMPNGTGDAQETLPSWPLSNFVEAGNDLCRGDWK